jgi:phage baseplate assembly protein W
MPNSLHDFFQKIPGSKSDVKDIDCSISSNGDLKLLENIDAVVRSVYNLLTTKKGTYLFDDEYGCDLYRYIFEQADETTKEDIFQSIELAIRTYGPENADISYDVMFMKDRKGFIVNIYVTYRGEKKELSVPIDESFLKTLPK